MQLLCNLDLQKKQKSRLKVKAYFSKGIPYLTERVYARFYKKPELRPPKIEKLL